METKHEYTALIVESSPTLVYGVILEVPGAASFAENKPELIKRLKNAAHCILESNKAEFKDVFTENFSYLGATNIHEELIPCY